MVRNGALFANGLCDIPVWCIILILNFGWKHSYWWITGEQGIIGLQCRSATCPEHKCLPLDNRYDKCQALDFELDSAVWKSWSNTFPSQPSWTHGDSYFWCLQNVLWICVILGLHVIWDIMGSNVSIILNMLYYNMIIEGSYTHQGCFYLTKY